jgi:hypothetical protein
MSQIIRIQNKFIHVPSISRIRILHSMIFRLPQIYMQDHSGEPTLITYRRRDMNKAVEDYKRLYTAVNTCQIALKQVPWMEEPSEVNPLVESEKPLR